MLDLDDEDRAFIDSLIPDDAVPSALLTVVAWLDPQDGSMRWISYNVTNEPVTSIVGLLEMAKLRALGDSDCGMPFAYTNPEDTET